MSAAAALTQLLELTGLTDRQLGAQLLDAAGGDVGAAATMFFDMDGDGGGSGGGGAPPPRPAAAAARLTDEQLAAQLAVLDSDGEDDARIVGDGGGGGRGGARGPPRGAGRGRDDDERGAVRAADEARTERMISHPAGALRLGAVGVAGQALGSFRVPHVPSAFMDAAGGAATRGGGGGGGPVAGAAGAAAAARSYGDGTAGFGGAAAPKRGGGVGGGGGGKPSLANLLGAPVDLIFPGPYETAREFAKQSQRWLLVNIQKDAEFDR
jgi:hypothetical protein